MHNKRHITYFVQPEWAVQGSTKGIGRDSVWSMRADQLCKNPTIQRAEQA